jgi:hypothetical protein
MHSEEATLPPLLGERAQPGNPLRAELLRRPRGEPAEEGVQPLAELRGATLLLDQLRRVPEQLIGIAQHAGPLQIPDAVNDLSWAGTSYREVTQVHDQVGKLALQVSDDGVQRRKIAMNIRDDCNAPGPMPAHIVADGSGCRPCGDDIGMIANLMATTYGTASSTVQDSTGTSLSAFESVPERPAPDALPVRMSGAFRQSAFHVTRSERMEASAIAVLIKKSRRSPSRAGRRILKDTYWNHTSRQEASRGIQGTV